MCEFTQTFFSTIHKIVHIGSPYAHSFVGVFRILLISFDKMCFQTGVRQDDAAQRTDI